METDALGRHPSPVIAGLGKDQELLVELGEHGPDRLADRQRDRKRIATHDHHALLTGAGPHDDRVVGGGDRRLEHAELLDERTDDAGGGVDLEQRPGVRQRENLGGCDRGEPRRQQQRGVGGRGPGVQEHVVGRREGRPARRGGAACRRASRGGL